MHCSSAIRPAALGAAVGPATRRCNALNVQTQSLKSRVGAPAARGAAPRCAAGDRPAAPPPAARLADAGLASLALWALTELPALAAPESMPGSPPAQSYYVSLGLFVMTVPGGCQPPERRRRARRADAIS
jgi:hypothetical protein